MTRQLTCQKLFTNTQAIFENVLKICLDCLPRYNNYIRIYCKSHRNEICIFRR